MNFFSLFLLLCFFIITLQPAHSLELQLSYSERKCFTEDVPPGGVLYAEFRVRSTSTSKSLTTTLEVRTSHGQEVTAVHDLTHHVFTHKAPANIPEPNFLQFCLSHNPRTGERAVGNPSSRVQFDLQIRPHDENYDYATRDDLDLTAENIRKVADRIDDVLFGIDVIRRTEQQIESQLKSTSTIITVVALLTTTLVLASAATQVTSVERFFRKKKFIS